MRSWPESRDSATGTGAQGISTNSSPRDLAECLDGVRLRGIGDPNQMPAYLAGGTAEANDVGPCRAAEAASLVF